MGACEVDAGKRAAAGVPNARSKGGGNRKCIPCIHPLHLHMLSLPVRLCVLPSWFSFKRTRRPWPLAIPPLPLPYVLVPLALKKTVLPTFKAQTLGHSAWLALLALTALITLASPTSAPIVGNA